MANFNKAFNFRGGFQVDTDVLIVRGDNVGIGSTIPNQRLVVDGIIQANGLDIKSTESVELVQAQAGVLTVTDYLNVGIETVNASAIEYPFGKPQVQIRTGIITSANPALGVVTYYGDGAQLLNLPTSQWLDTDVGLGFTSIYAQGNVGVATDDPRYSFQVGNNPFDTVSGPFLRASDGVGIEDGNIYASGIVSTRGEFSGVGSNITLINADNIAIGSIGSMRYGDTIVTKEVYADRFIGIADTAASVTLDAELVFTSGIATDFQTEELIVTGISSVNIVKVKDHLQVGDTATPGNVGDIEVFKDSSQDSYIYSLSDSGSGNIFVGRERVGGTGREFGGIRKGAIPGINISGTEDLDLVNYDIGNVNYYLHAGSGGPTATTGSFRWIYGQTNTIMAEMARDGRFDLNGNIDPDAVTLAVNGNVTTKDISADGRVDVTDGMNVAGISTFLGDVEFQGNIDVNQLNITGDIGISTLLIGPDPEIGGTGTKIGEDGAYIAGVAQFKKNTTTLFAGDIQADTFLGNVSGSTVSFTSNLSGPAGFSVSSDGDISSQGDLSVGTINATNANITNFGASSVNLSGDISASNISLTGSLNASSAELDDLTVNNNFNFGGSFTTLNAGTVNANVVNSPIVKARSRVETAGITTTGNLIVQSNAISLEGASVGSVGEVSAFSASVQFLVMGGKRVTFEFQDGGSAGVGTMVVLIGNPVTGQFENSVSLPYDSV